MTLANRKIDFVMGRGDLQDAAPESWIDASSPMMGISFRGNGRQQCLPMNRWYRGSPELTATPVSPISVSGAGRYLQIDPGFFDDLVPYVVKLAGGWRGNYFFIGKAV